MIFFVDHCRDAIRTLPMQQHDENRPEFGRTEGEDHAVDEIPLRLHVAPVRGRLEANEDLNPLLIANAFKLDELT